MKDFQSETIARGRTIAIVGGAVIGVALLCVALRFRPEFEAWLRQNPRERIWIVVIVFIALVLPVLVFAGHLWCLAGRVRRARLLRALAVVLAVAGLLLIALFWRIAATIAA
jgi:hypothetical protein